MVARNNQGIAAPARETAVDFLVIGSGIAGLYCALTLAAGGADVLILTKSRLTQGNTQFAQGGIAAAFNSQDSPELHLQDTIYAGAGLCAEPAARVMVEEGPRFVRDLIALGAHFDRENGELALAREGAHTLHRVLRARGDATGEEIEEALSRQARTVRVKVMEDVFAEEVVLDGRGRCQGVLAAAPDGRALRFLSRATILATGGAGQIYSSTTNSTVVTGDGMAMAMRAGATLMDMEFFQFHPTALALEANPRFLISEAVRGEGAVLLDANGQRFMPGFHPMADLAPRDVVARAIIHECERLGTANVWLDARKLHGGPARERFPTIYSRCRAQGLDMERDLIPVAPVAHYCVGGIRTDTWARTTVFGLLACGETACVGVHGANRLASNSLLESLVFAGRAASFALRWKGQDWRPDLLEPEGAWTPARKLPFCLAEVRQPTGPAPDRGAGAAGAAGGEGAGGTFTGVLRRTREVMWRDYGIVRRGGSMFRALDELDELGQALCAGWPSPPPSGAQVDSCLGEARNVLSTAYLVALSAEGRNESRGAHYREDYPQSLPEWSKHTLLRLSQDKIFRAFAPLENVEV